ncbi:MAG: ornithine carbamoyltransferase [Candidatus Puniceispirillaceae bacterium]
MMRHFLDLKDFDKSQLQALLDYGIAVRADLKAGIQNEQPLAGQHIGMIFEKPSTRTRVSFEVGISQLGGTPIILSTNDMQLGRGETVSDTARVLSSYLDGIMIRCLQHDTLMALADNADIPVINGLTNRSHPCQVMADMMTMIDYHGAIEGQIVTWAGDGNNVAVSWLEAAAIMDFELRLACPQGYEPPAELIAWARAKGATISLSDDLAQAAKDADVLVTDVWISMGDDEGTRIADMTPFQVNDEIMALAAPDAIFMHCLPAIREMEVTASVIDGTQSAVWREAENRLHAQKAVLAYCAGKVI